MASRPLLHLFGKMVAEKGGEEYIFGKMQENVPIRQIIKEFINPTTGKHFHHAMMYQWIHQDEDREAEWRRIRKISSHTLVDEAGEILDDAEGKLLTPADVSLLKERTSHKKWLAGQYNRDDYGKPEEKMGVTLAFDSAFLQALQAKGSSHRLPPAEPEEAEYVLVDNPIGELLP